MCSISGVDLSKVSAPQVIPADPTICEETTPSGGAAQPDRTPPVSGRPNVILDSMDGDQDHVADANRQPEAQRSSSIGRLDEDRIDGEHEQAEVQTEGLSCVGKLIDDDASRMENTGSTAPSSEHLEENFENPLDVARAESVSSQTRAGVDLDLDFTSAAMTPTKSPLQVAVAPETPTKTHSPAQVAKQRPKAFNMRNPDAFETADISPTGPPARLHSTPQVAEQQPQAGDTTAVETEELSMTALTSEQATHEIIVKETQEPDSENELDMLDESQAALGRDDSWRHTVPETEVQDMSKGSQDCFVLEPLLERQNTRMLELRRLEIEQRRSELACDRLAALAKSKVEALQPGSISRSEFERLKSGCLHLQQCGLSPPATTSRPVPSTSLGLSPPRNTSRPSASPAALVTNKFPRSCSLTTMTPTTQSPATQSATSQSQATQSQDERVEEALVTTPHSEFIPSKRKPEGLPRDAVKRVFSPRPLAGKVTLVQPTTPLLLSNHDVEQPNRHANSLVLCERRALSRIARHPDLLQRNIPASSHTFKTTLESPLSSSGLHEAADDPRTRKHPMARSRSLRGHPIDNPLPGSGGNRTPRLLPKAHPNNSRVAKTSSPEPQFRTTKDGGAAVQHCDDTKRMRQEPLPDCRAKRSKLDGDGISYRDGDVLVSKARVQKVGDNYTSDSHANSDRSNDGSAALNDGGRSGTPITTASNSAGSREASGRDRSNLSHTRNTEKSKGRAGSTGSRASTRRKRVLLVTTGIGKSETVGLVKLADRLGGHVSRDWTKHCTHLVSKPCRPDTTAVWTDVTRKRQEDERQLSHHTRRTLKFMLGVLSGMWLVSYDWAVQSAKAGKWLSEADFEICGEARHPLTYAPRLGRQARKRGVHLFSGLTLRLYTADLRAPGPSKKDLILLARTGGARVVSPWPSSNSDQETVDGYLLCDPSLSFDTAVDIRQRGLIPLSYVWLLDCISCYRLLDFSADYQLDLPLDDSDSELGEEH